MKKIIILLTFCFVSSSLFLLGCSKSNKAVPLANGGNSQAAGNNAASAPNGPVDMKIKWQTGKQYPAEMDLTENTDINIPNRPLHQQLTLTQGMHFTPLNDTADGGHQFEMEFDRQSMDYAQNGNDQVNYDSTKSSPADANNPVATVIQAMLGLPLDYSIGPDGTVEKIDGYDKMMDRIKASTPNQQQLASLKQLFDEDTLKQYGSFWEALPDHSVNVGDSWSITRDVQTTVGLMTVSLTYTFQDWEQHNNHNCIHLTATGHIESKTTSASMGYVVDVKEGTITGDTWYDPAQGIFVDANNSEVMKLDITTREQTLTGQVKRNIQMTFLDAGS
jgi:hypothetical protein